MITRDPYIKAWRELAAEKSLVLIAGPRQCGKTTLAEMISETFVNRVNLNWDVPGSKARMIQDPFFFQNLDRKDASRPIVVLDEIHKYNDWKNYLKGVYDQFHNDYSFLVTGSGRLDAFKKGGDSLAGRYRLLHLWPLTLAELGGQQTSIAAFRADPVAVVHGSIDVLEEMWRRLELFSGFPEPYVAAEETKFRRWAQTYQHQLILEDIRSLTDIRTVGNLEILFELLPSKVGSPLSIANLANDLQVTYPTVKSWLQAFEQFYLIFTIMPWTGGLARTIHKERKTYLMNFQSISDSGAKFENMVAVELFRAVSYWNDMGYGDFGLHYMRTREGHEVDFVITEGPRPFLLVEAKLSDQDVSSGLRRFQKALRVPAVQLVAGGSTHKLLDNEGQRLLVAPACRWLVRLP